ncbi:MAG: hypothetical protein K2L66_06555, partial [Paramuribaculum sp.]|nr:hypothetical protein [Paramuribaculum sp.]
DGQPTALSEASRQSRKIAADRRPTSAATIKPHTYAFSFLIPHLPHYFSLPAVIFPSTLSTTQAGQLSCPERHV